MDANEYHKAIDLPNVKGTGKLRGRALSISEIESLTASCYMPLALEMLVCTLIEIF